MPVQSSKAFAATGLILVMVLGSLLLWLAVPIGWLWVASQINRSLDPSFGAYILIAIGIPATMLAMFMLLRRVDAVHRSPDRHPRRSEARPAAVAAQHARRARHARTHLRPRHDPRRDRDHGRAGDARVVCVLRRLAAAAVALGASAAAQRDQAADDEADDRGTDDELARCSRTWRRQSVSSPTRPRRASTEPASSPRWRSMSRADLLRAARRGARARARDRLAGALSHR